MERLPSHAGPVELRPDWVCEVLSPSNATNDTVRKLRVYHQFAVPHYWILDPEAQSLIVYRWAADGYMAVVAAEAGERVRCEPFDAIEFEVGVLFGADPPASV
jgi:Uma2 family endonuclease